VVLAGCAASWVLAPLESTDADNTRSSVKACYVEVRPLPIDGRLL
jgi:hypothetical protein